MKRFTHDDLVAVAAEWLQRNRCPVVITEMVTTGEIPDAIGFSHAGITTLIECKVSRSDFLRDANKVFRKYQEEGLARYRYYMAPKGVITPNDVHKGWGLIVVNENGRTRRTVMAEFQEQRDRAHRKEIGLLVSAMRRLSATATGINVKVYQIENSTKTTIGIEPETIV